MIKKGGGEGGRWRRERGILVIDRGEG